MLSDNFVDENRTKILVRCKCGKEFAINKSNLTLGTSKSCGIGDCYSLRIDEIGNKYGYLLVLEKAIPTSGYVNSDSLHWKCDCGTISIIRGPN